MKTFLSVPVRFFACKRPLISSFVCALWACTIGFIYPVQGLEAPSASSTISTSPVAATLVIDKPADGSVFPVPAIVSMALTAVDPDGDIRHVEFFANDFSIGRSDQWTKDAIVPGRPRTHFFDWNIAMSGVYRLTAHATNTLGNLVQSKPVTITVGTPLPVVSIEATAPETSEPSPTIRVRAGAFTLTRSGETSGALTVYVGYEGSATPGKDYKALPSTVTFPVGSETVQLLVEPIEDELIEGTESVIATLNDGPFDRLPDFQIDSNRSTAKVLIHDTSATTGATIAITAPPDGAVFKLGEPVPIEATAVDLKGYIARVEFYDGETLIGVSQITFIRAPDPGTPIHHSFQWQSPPAGDHVLTARGVDSSGKIIISQSVRISVESEPGVRLPTVGISAVQSEAMEMPPLVDVIVPARFSVWREGDLSQELYIDYSLHGTAERGKDYSDPPSPLRIAPGEREVILTIVPRSDNVTEPMETVGVRIENPLPISSLPVPTAYQIEPSQREAAAVIFDRTRPTNGALELAFPSMGETYAQSDGVPFLAAAFHPTLDVTHVDFFADEQRIGDSNIAFIKPNGGGLIVHHFTWKNPPAGQHTLTARASLPDGTVLVSSKVLVTIRVSPQAPVVTITGPQNGSVFTLGDVIEIVAEAHSAQPLKSVDLVVDGMPLVSSPVSPLMFQWAASTPGPHLLMAKAIDSSGAEGTAAPVKILIREVESVAFVKRQLPAGYVPGNLLEVNLRAEPPAGANAWGLQDSPPPGWLITKVSAEGVFDAVTGQVKFGVFTDATARTFTYTLSAPANALGPQTFKGSSSIDGKVLPTGGDSVVLAVDERHPADRDPSDTQIALPELTAYAAAWKQGSSWPAGPVPIPLPFVTRAGQIWKAGEKYTYDPTKGAPPLCWVPMNVRLVGLASSGAPSQAVRELSMPISPGGPIDVRITVSPSAATDSFGLQEQLPPGCTAVNVSDDGFFDARDRSVRWGLFLDDAPRVLTYRVVASASSGGVLRGALSCDGQQTVVLGAKTLTSGQPEARPHFGSLEHHPDGKVRLPLSGLPDGLWILEGSEDLLRWTEVSPVFLPDGTIGYELESQPDQAQRFFRLRSP